MAVLSVMAITGDAEELLAKLQSTIDPVAARKAAQYGGISSTVVRTDDGIKVFNLWQTEAGRHEMAADPEILAAVKAADFPEPKFKGYEVLSQRSITDRGREIAQRLVDEVWTQGKLDAIDELIADDFIGDDPVNGEIHGPDGFRELVQMYRTAFSGVTMRADKIVADGDWVAVHWTATGTHTGELMGVAPTGRDISVTGTQFSRISDGKVIASRGLFDAFGMLQQIGAVPAATAGTTA